MAGERKAVGKGHDRRVAMDQHQIEPTPRSVGHRRLFRRVVLADQDVTDGRRDQRFGAPCLGGVEQRVQLKPEGAAAEGKGLDQDAIGLHFLEEVKQRFGARRLPTVVDRFAVRAKDRCKVCVRDPRGRQAHDRGGTEIDLRHGEAAIGDRHPVPLGDHRLGQQRRAPDMADAEQMLDIEQDVHAGRPFRGPFRGTFRRWSRRPSRWSNANSWPALKSSLSGGLLSMIQPTASA